MRLPCSTLVCAAFMRAALVRSASSCAVRCSTCACVFCGLSVTVITPGGGQDVEAVGGTSTGVRATSWIGMTAAAITAVAHCQRRELPGVSCCCNIMSLLLSDEVED